MSNRRVVGITRFSGPPIAQVSFLSLANKVRISKCRVQIVGAYYASGRNQPHGRAF